MQPFANVPSVLVVSSLLMLGCRSDTDQTTIERHLADTIPSKSTVAHVLEYLDKEGIEHSQYLRSATEGNSINAMVRSKSRFKLVRTDFGIVFRFDDHDRLISYTVRPVHTGP